MAQFTDGFGDGEFTSNPAWTGDVSQFTVNSAFQLQLNSSGEAVSSLASVYLMNGETEWRFWIKLPFSPSANNFTRVYLASNQADLKGLLNGYFLQFGEGGSADAIELFRQQQTTLTSVCRGTEGMIANSFELAIKVRRNQTGNWEIQVDESGAGAYQTIATGSDNTINSSGFLGVYCKFTASNSTKFYFDDFYAGPFVFDIQAPTISMVEVKSPQALDIFFSEAVTEISCQNIQNYSANNNLGNPYSASRDISTFSLVHLIFERPFQNGVTNLITIRNIADFAGNVAGTLTADFSWFTPAAFDIQINEIMADPSPTVFLPEFEYLELYNRTFIPINLQGWKLIIGTSEKVFENVIIPPDSFLIVADDAAAGSFIFNGPFYGFSSFALTNAGQLLVLKNTEDAVISTVRYSDEWYNDPVKFEGGWSLEQIDPENPCGGANNWKVSISPAGGTPGVKNSVFGSNPDQTAPELSRVISPSEGVLQVYFTEPIDSAGLSNPLIYNIDHEIGNPLTATAVAPDYSSVLLALPAPFQTGIIYTISLVGDVTDCAGNVADKNQTVIFGIPEPALAGDVVINEVLYNPKDDFVTGVDFVEIYNRSAKIINLADLVLATVDQETGQIASVKNISDEGFLFFPQLYLVLTVNPDIVKQQYFTTNPDGFLKMLALPLYNNDSGAVILATKGLEIIDRLEYSEAMQFPLLNSFDGVSLERINFNRPSEDFTNWHSAAEDVGFATPAYQNSQFGEVTEVADPISLEPEVFSPDNDGYDDFLTIHYHFDAPGNMGTITIFDSRGRLIRNLINNQLLGTEGVFTWDGVGDDNQKALIGIYIVFVRIFDLNGGSTNYKKTTVVGGGL